MGQNIFLLVCSIMMVSSCLAFYDENQKLQDGYDYSLMTSEALSIYDLLRADKVCTRPGRMCKNCTTRVNCVEVSPGKFEEHGLHTCLSDETCKTTDCEIARNPPCEPAAQLTFECRHFGMFPDQFNCKRLHMCAPGSDGGFVMYTLQCTANFSYNPLTTYCDTPLLEDGACYAPDRVPEWPVPPCEEVGQMGAILENKSIYFVCELYGDTGILYPFIQLCAQGGQFNEDLMKCEPKAPAADASVF